MEATRRRAPREILARARITCFVCGLADGMEIDPQWLADLGLEPHVTPEEREWFSGESTPTPECWWPATAMLDMAWSLGLLGEKEIDDGDFIDVYGAIANRLTVDSMKESDLSEELAPRDDTEVRARMARFEEYARGTDGLPPNRQYSAPELRWHHAGLAWVMDATLTWPPAPETMLTVTSTLTLVAACGSTTAQDGDPHEAPDASATSEAARLATRA
jgi:hypothetical protein